MGVEMLELSRAFLIKYIEDIEKQKCRLELFKATRISYFGTIYIFALGCYFNH